MSQTNVPPSISKQSFNCPRCGALAHQSWYSTLAKKLTAEGKELTPNLVTIDFVESIKIDEVGRGADFRVPNSIMIYFKTAARGDAFLYKKPESEYCIFDLANIHISQCFSCKEISLWRYDRLLYPEARYAVEPNPDMDEDICVDFNEARSILNLSPRGAAALLRLCIQKLCKQLGKPGKNINEDIASLVQDGLDPMIQKSLDIVRITGNSAVHPAEMDLRDDREAAAKLFDLVNLIAYDRLTRPRQISALFSSLPEDKLAAIEKRDGKTS